MNYLEDGVEDTSPKERRFSKTTIKMIREYVGGLCCNCGKDTTHYHRGGGNTNLGEAAHINAVSDLWPRFDPEQSDFDCSSFENGLWLCRKCHKIIDAPGAECRYPARELVRMREMTRRQLERNSQKGLIPGDFDPRHEEAICNNFRDKIRVVWDYISRRDRNQITFNQEMVHEIRRASYGFTFHPNGWNVGNPLRSLNPAHFDHQDDIIAQLGVIADHFKKIRWVPSRDYPYDPNYKTFELKNPPRGYLEERAEVNELREQLEEDFQEAALMIQAFMEKPTQLYPGRQY
ncbi:hypothetical protein ACYPKM_04995 [Pseudomonas aeruginosa]